MAKEETTIFAASHCAMHQYQSKRTMLIEVDSYHRPHFHQILVCPFILRHSLDPSLFNGIFAGKALHPRAQRISDSKGLAGNGTGIVGIDWQSRGDVFLRMVAMVGAGGGITLHIILILDHPHSCGGVEVPILEDGICTRRTADFQMSRDQVEGKESRAG